MEQQLFLTISIIHFNKSKFDKKVFNKIKPRHFQKYSSMYQCNRSFIYQWKSKYSIDSYKCINIIISSKSTTSNSRSSSWCLLYNSSTNISSNRRMFSLPNSSFDKKEKKKHISKFDYFCMIWLKMLFAWLWNFVLFLFCCNFPHRRNVSKIFTKRHMMHCTARLLVLLLVHRRRQWWWSIPIRLSLFYRNNKFPSISLMR